MLPKKEEIWAVFAAAAAAAVVVVVVAANYSTCETCDRSREGREIYVGLQPFFFLTLTD